MLPLNVRRIAAGDHPLSPHPLLSGRLAAALAAREYRRLVHGTLEAARELEKMEIEPLIKSKRDVENPTAMTRALVKVMRDVSALEAGHEAELEELAKRVTAEVHGLSEEEANELFAKPRLLRALEAPEGTEERLRRPGLGGRGEELLKEIAKRREELLKEIAKRRTHNAIIQGTALSHMRDALVLAKSELDRIDPTLYPRYMFFSNLGLLGNFVVPIPDYLPDLGLQAGQVKLRWKRKGQEDKPMVVAKALNFPALVQELSKGVVETSMAHGLPGKLFFSEEELEEFERQTGTVHHEPWYFLVGPALARRLQRAMVKHNAVVRYGKKPNPLRDLMYSRTLLSMLPEEELHAVLPELLGAKTAEEEKEAAGKLLAKLKLEEERCTRE